MTILPSELLIPWNGKGFKPRSMAAGDVSYFCPTKEMVEKDLYPNFRKWLAALNLGKWYHKWDCDNFAMAFKVFADGYYFNTIESNAESIAIGIIHYIAEARAESGIKGGHAINILYLNDGKNELGLNKFKVMYLEPQNGNIYELSEEEFKSIFFLYV